MMQNRFILPCLSALVMLVAIALPSSAIAQLPFKVDVPDSIVTMREGQLLDVKAYITNLASEPIDVRAVRFRNEIPEGAWYTAMCFGDQCYTAETNVTPPARIAAGATAEFKLTVGTDEPSYGIEQ